MLNTITLTSERLLAEMQRVVADYDCTAPTARLIAYSRYSGSPLHSRHLELYLVHLDKQPDPLNGGTI